MVRFFLKIRIKKSIKIYVRQFSINPKTKKMESTLFTEVLRVQLTTTSQKPDTYIAIHNGTRKFVKGPFRTFDDANVANLVNANKVKMDPSLHVLTHDIVEATVDLFPDTPLGIRNKLRGQQGFFQVTECLIDEETIPTTTRTSKAYTTPVTVVDWDKVTSVKHQKYSKEAGGSTYATTPELASQMVKHILLSQKIGTSADITNRDFIFKGDKCYHVDTDVHNNKKKWMVGQTQVGSMRTQAGPQMIEHFHKDLMAWSEYTTQVLGYTEGEWNILDNFPTPPPRKRKIQGDEEATKKRKIQGDEEVTKKIKIKI